MKNKVSIAVIGLGYVGLPLAIEFSKKRPVSTKSVKTKSMHVDVPYRRETKEYPSYDSFKGSTARKESQTYTGDYIIGIATMHKSNLVPITSKEAAKDAATMRRN